MTFIDSVFTPLAYPQCFFPDGSPCVPVFSINITINITKWLDFYRMLL